jgi:hypothetical protein
MHLSQSYVMEFEVGEPPLLLAYLRLPELHKTYYVAEI